MIGRFKKVLRPHLLPFEWVRGTKTQLFGRNRDKFCLERDQIGFRLSPWLDMRQSKVSHGLEDGTYHEILLFKTAELAK